MKFDINMYENAINDILLGLALYVRDVNLSDKLDEKYVENMIILERGFTDASSKVGGVLTTHRFAILSNHMADFSDYEQDTDWGLFVANHSSHFLILHKYEYNGKTQIILLHLPNDKRWKLFQNAKINVLDDIVKKVRDKFEVCCSQEVIPELATEQWLERCAAPLGMDEKDNLFDLEITLQNHLKPIEKTSFRELLNKIIYIKPTDEFKNRLGKHFKGIGKDDGFLAYEYIDEEAGLSFKVLSSANIRNNKLSRGLFNEEHEFIIRVGGLKGCEYLDLK